MKNDIFNIAIQLLIPKRPFSIPNTYNMSILAVTYECARIKQHNLTFL